MMKCQETDILVQKLEFIYDSHTAAFCHILHSNVISFSKRIKQRKISSLFRIITCIWKKTKKSISPGRLQYLPLLYTCLKSPEMGVGGKVKNQDYQIDYILQYFFFTLAHYDVIKCLTLVLTLSSIWTPITWAKMLIKFSTTMPHHQIK
jgi:hypothetical protein